MTKFIQKTSLLIVLFSLLLSSTADAQFRSKKGSGNIQKENREITSFTKISAASGLNVYLKQGDKESLVVEADENLLENISTNVKSDRLILKIEGSFKRATKLNVYVTVVDLSEITISSGANVKTRGVLTSSNLEINVDSGGRAEMEIKAKDVTCITSSGANALLTGETAYFAAEASSGSTLKAKDLLSKVVKVEASSASNASLYALEAIDADASSCAHITYYGNPDKVKTNNSSLGSVNSRQ